MHFRNAILTILFCATCALCPLSAAVTVSTIDYKDGDVALRGTLALPEHATGPVPGVLVVHEWWGHNDYADRRARELAEAGYAAFAVDMFGTGKVTENPQQAGAWAGPFYSDRGLLLARVRAGLEQLRHNPAVDAKHIAAIGFCFGGTVCLELARSGEPLSSVVSFHGGLKTSKPATAGTVAAKILVLHGGADPLVSAADFAAFMDEMTAAQVSWRSEIYGSAVHAFSNPAAARFHQQLPPVNYDADAERRAITAMRGFLAETLTATP